MNYYLSDPHFGHEMIRDFFKRPFENTDEMDQAMITNINAVVADEDDLFILGDFSGGELARDDVYLREIFGQIRGRKHLIIGNHDTQEVADLPWSSRQNYLELVDQGVIVVLFHYPLMTWNFAREGAFHLFGHSHVNWEGSILSANMCVEHWGYRPVELQEIINRAAKFELPPNWDKVEPNVFV